MDKYSQYGWLTYLLVLNGLLLLLGGRCIVSVISYPYSSRIFRRNLSRTTNEKFGEEFKRCVSRIVDIIDQISTKSDDTIISEILIGTSDENLETSDGESFSQSLSSKEIYHKIAQNIELINLYTCINEKIILQNPQSVLFVDVTQTLRDIRTTMDRIEIKTSFQHMWFPQNKFHSFWAYYNKVNTETEKQSDPQTIRRFLQRQTTPSIVKNEGNKKNIVKLKELNETLNQLIRSSVRKCCTFNIGEVIFGRLDQAKLILKETFEGTHIFVDGPDNNKIDCMFFPCTHSEKILIDHNQDLDGSIYVPGTKSTQNSVNDSTRARSQPHHLIEDLF